MEEAAGLGGQVMNRASSRLGGLYEETGLYEGPAASWGATHGIIIVPVHAPAAIQRLWGRICEDLAPMPAHFGPEGLAPRPRPQDRYWGLWLDEHGATGKACGDGRLIGLAWTQAPAPTTRTYAFGLFPEARRQGHGVCVKTALLEHCFSEAAVQKVETEVYSSNPVSLAILHGPDDPMTGEGRQVATIEIAGVFHDRMLFGITRARWAAWLAAQERSDSQPPGASVQPMSSS